MKSSDAADTSRRLTDFSCGLEYIIMINFKRRGRYIELKRKRKLLNSAYYASMWIFD